MIKLLIVILNQQLKHSKLFQTNKGFTLIELLIAMFLAVLITTPLMGVAFNIMDSDRKEQVKSNSEQEIKSALDYIASDLQEAVYIYDDIGIAAIKSQLPDATSNTRVPVLVFWKRELREDAVPALTSATCPPTSSTDNCNDAFVYSLVAYYIIKENSPVWSNTARIGRFQISDGVKDPNSSTGAYLDSYPRNRGFQMFNLNEIGTLGEKMNRWTKKEGEDYENRTLVVIDYIDQSTGAGVPERIRCATTSSDAKLVPAVPTIANSADTDNPNPLNIYSFHACVDSSRTLAQVYLRGNALTRISNGATYSNSQSTYFPTATVIVRGRGSLSGE